MKVKHAKIILYLIVMCLLLQVFNMPSLAAQKHWADAYVNQLKDDEILKDYLKDNGNILKGLDNSITRGQFLGLLFSLAGLGLNVDDSHKVAFEDMGSVPEKLIPMVQEASQTGVISGIEKNGKAHLDWNSNITRQDAITIAGKLCHLSSLDSVTYSDKAQIASYAYTYVAAFAKNNIISNTPNKPLKPRGFITKGEVLSIICMLINQGYIFSDKVDDFAGDINGYLDGDSSGACFLMPMGLTATTDGSILVVDSNNNLIRKIRNGKVETIAGKPSVIYDNFNNPLGGFVNGNVTTAKFNKPEFCTIDNQGRIFVSDTANNSVRIISGNQVTSINASGIAGFKDGNMTGAAFNAPTGIVADRDGNLYVADTLNHCIRYVNFKANTISTIAGKPGTAGFRDGKVADALLNEPVGLAIDKKNVLYIADSGNQRIRKIDKGSVVTIAGSGTTVLEGTSYFEGGYSDGVPDKAKFNFPNGIAIDDNGVIYVADSVNQRIRAITSKKVVTVAGNGDAGYLKGMPRSASFNNPTGILYKAGKIYISDSFNGKIRAIRVNTNLLK